jgi:hypothetical protein
MDFLVKGNDLSFLSEENALKDYLIFYFDKQWEEFNERYVLISNAKTKNFKVKITKNYIEIPSNFKDSKLLSIRIIGENDLDRIETNNAIGRRA